MKEILDKLKRQIEKEYGKKCPDFEPTCILCQIWKKYDMLREELLK